MAGEGFLVGRFVEDLEFVAIHGGGQIVAQASPGVALAGGFEEIIAAVVDGFVVVDRNGDRRVPLKAIVRVAVLGLRLDGTFLTGAHVAAREEAILRFGIDDVGVDVVNGGVETVATVNQGPVFVDDAVAGKGGARTAPTAVVLQAAADVIGLFVVEAAFTE